LGGRFDQRRLQPLIRWDVGGDTTLFKVLAKMETATTESAVEGFAFVLNRIKAQKRLSMKYDQGKEMSDHNNLTMETGVKA